MFAELLGRSCFSFLEGGSQPEEMVEEAVRLGLPGLGLCDRNGLYGVVRGWVRHKELLAEKTAAPGGVARGGIAPGGSAQGKADSPPPSQTTLEPTALAQTPHKDFRYALGAELSLLEFSATESESSFSLALLVQDRVGYENLCRILTLGHEGREKGICLCAAATIAAHSAGLYALWVPARKSRSLDAAAVELCSRLTPAFPGRMAVAFYRHLDGFDRERERSVEEAASRLALPIFATARPFYHAKERRPLFDVLHCIRHGITLDQAGVELSGNAEPYLRSEREMLRLFRDHPEWVHKSGEIFETLNFSLQELTYHFPCQLEVGQTADQRLSELTWEGVGRRYPGGISEELREQIKKELKLIQKIQVAPYFLSVRDIVEMARKKRILCQGRGSAANSAVCYMLGITAVDPARCSLLFERFLSEERAEPPDIDIDFEHERREEVIQEIYARYGRDRAAMVSEVISYRGKSALREVGKVFGFNAEQIQRLSGAMDGWEGTASEPRLAEAGFDVQDARLAQVVTLARLLQGFPRHLSIHVGGFVLSSRPLSEVAPVEPARMAERTVIPWDKDDIDALGFFKVDVLGLGMLSAIRKALELVVQGGGLQARSGHLGTQALSQGPGEKRASETGAKEAEPFDPLEVIARIPAEDGATYDMICRADTVGVFQIESRAQMSMLPRLRPRNFYDLVIEVALVRPGPIQGGMVHPYLRRRNGEEELTYPHPDLAPILGRTLGVPLFQEQVMQIAIAGAGYTGGEADQLRRDMAAWKKHGRLLRHREKLLAGFKAQGIKEHFAAALFEQIKGFGEYGFPESHASSFALLVYSSSWLKAHYPAHFTCALLNSQPMGFYAPTTLVRDAQKHGVRVEDVCVLQSSWDSTLEELSEEEREEAGFKALETREAFAREGQLVPHENRPHWRSEALGSMRKIRLGLRLIRGLSKEGALRLEEARAEGKTLSLEMLLKRARLRRNEIDALAQAGAFEALEPGRRKALWKTRAPDTPGLFSEVRSFEPEVELPALRAVDQLVLDYEQKGLSLEDHPLVYYRNRLQKQGAIRASDLRFLAKGSQVKVAGLVMNRQRPATASGVVFMTLEDETGFLNLIVKSDIFEAHHHVARHTELLFVEGVLERDRPSENTEHAPALHALTVHGPSLRDPVIHTPVIHVLVRSIAPLRSYLASKSKTSSSKKATSPLPKLSRNFR
jgi:error-prone DNA polymerase